MSRKNRKNKGRDVATHIIGMLPGAEAVLEAGGDAARRCVHEAATKAVAGAARGLVACAVVRIGDARLLLYASRRGGSPDVVWLARPDDIDGAPDVPEPLRDELRRYAHKVGLLPPAAAN